jgi:hypothetical protein
MLARVKLGPVDAGNNVPGCVSIVGTAHKVITGVLGVGGFVAGAKMYDAQSDAWFTTSGIECSVPDPNGTNTWDLYSIVDASFNIAGAFAMIRDDGFSRSYQWTAGGLEFAETLPYPATQVEMLVCKPP